MATTFLEPGGDADFAVTTTNGFWNNIFGTPAVATDFVHGGHIKSIKYRPNVNDEVRSAAGTLADAGSRISFYMYLVTLPGSDAFIFGDSGNVFNLLMSSDGTIKLYVNAGQIGSNGPALVTGQWYRISLAYTITSTTVNRWELFVDGVSKISVTNATVTTGSSIFRIGNVSGNAALDFRSSDHYIDNSAALTDPGNIWVTAKRPNANGTTNGFSTQIGAGGSGYGTGHSPQVNERALSTTNGWSMVGAGSAVTEEYNIESTATGDIDISTATIVDWMGWASMKSLAGETVNIILNGANVAQAITSTITLYTAIKGSATYPVGAGTDIGIQTDTSLTTVSLYECGVVVAYIPSRLFLLTQHPGTIGANNPVDGYVYVNTVNQAFSICRTQNGDQVSYNADSSLYTFVTASGSTDNFYRLCRSIMCFDTSSLPDTATITAVTLSLYCTGKTNGVGSIDAYIGAVTPANTNALVAADYDIANFTATSFGSIVYASLTTSAYNDFVLNASGIANVSLTGITSFALRCGWDILNTTPTWSASAESQLTFNSSEGGSSVWPKLVVTYTIPTSVKTVGGLAVTSVKTFNGIAGLVKTINGLA